MTAYDPAALPSLNKSDVVRVKMGIALFQIRELVSAAAATSATSSSSSSSLYYNTTNVHLVGCVAQLVESRSSAGVLSLSYLQLKGDHLHVCE